jgi:hypothetical protein
MNGLDAQGRHLLILLVAKLKDVIPGTPGTYVSYKDVYEQLGFKKQVPYGRFLKNHGLDSLADWAKAEGKPGITGIVIERKTSMPGKGYFHLFGKEPTDVVWWHEQVRLSKGYDWSGHLPDSVFPEAPQPSDFSEPTSRQASTTYRILRDTNLARQVKSLHQYQCQLCGYAIRLPNGLAYAEAHHMRPLGEPHNGPDVMENIVCLCPNHHAELDYGSRPLQGAELNIVPGHSVGEKYIRYHNEVICRRECGA